MRELIRAEARKITTGTTIWTLAVVGISLGALFTEGFTQEARTLLDAGVSDAPTQTSVIVRSWMAMTLVSAILGALLVTREYTSGSISRSVLVAGGRDRVLAAKLVVGTAGGAVFGALAAVLAVGVVQFAMPRAGAEVAWTQDATLTALGIFGTTTLSATWGVLMGWIIRSQIGSVLAIVGLTLLIEPGVQAVAPRVAAFLFTIAMTGVNLDGKPDLLSIGGSYVVLAGWLVVLGLVARALLVRRDLT